MNYESNSKSLSPDLRQVTRTVIEERGVQFVSFDPNPDRGNPRLREDLLGFAIDSHPDTYVDVART